MISHSHMTHCTGQKHKTRLLHRATTASKRMSAIPSQAKYFTTSKVRHVTCLYFKPAAHHSVNHITLHASYSTVIVHCVSDFLINIHKNIHEIIILNVTTQHCMHNSQHQTFKREKSVILTTERQAYRTTGVPGYSYDQL